MSFFKGFLFTLTSLAILLIIVTAGAVKAQENDVLIEDGSLSAEEFEAVSAPSIYTTEITNVTAEMISDRTYRVSFELSNGNTPQSGIKYRVALRPENSEDGSDNNLYGLSYPEILSLGAGESLKRQVDFEIPSYVDGTYFISVELGGEEGIKFSVGVADIIVDLSAITSPVVLNTDSCFVSVVGEEGEYELGQGVDLAGEEFINLVCKFTNISNSAIELIPKFETRIRSSWGALVEVSDVFQQKISLNPGEQDVSIKLPKADFPQAFDLTVNFEGSYLPPVIVHYVNQGESATIHNLITDKPGYEVGDMAKLSVAWTGSADNFFGSRASTSPDVEKPMTLSVLLRSLDGQICADEFKQDLPALTHDVLNLEIPISNTCATVVAEARIVGGNGEVLYTRTFNFASSNKVVEEIAEASKPVNEVDTWVFVAVASVAFLAIVMMILYYRRNRGVDIMTAVLIAVSALGVSLTVYASSYNSDTEMWSVADQAWSRHTATIAFSAPADRTYGGSNNLIWTGDITAVNCANTVARSSYNLSIYNSGGGRVVNYSAGGDNYTRSYRASTFANGRYRAVNRWTDTGCQYIVGGSTANYPANRTREHQCITNPAVSQTTYFTIDNPPSGSVSAGGCTIAAGASTCTVPVDWTISNPNGSANLRNLTHNYVYSWAASGNNVWQTLWYGTQTIAARDGSTNLATVNVTASCVAGTVWAGGICSPSPIINFSAAPVLVGPGNSSTLTWTVSGATSCSASGGWSGAKSNVSGNEVVTPGATTVYTITCAGPGGSSSRNATVTLPTGSITAGACTIAPEASSCPATVSWTANNFLGAAQVTQTASGQVAASNPGTLAVSPADRTVRLDDLGSNYEITATANPTCTTGGVWVPSLNRCAGLPEITIDADPDVIRSGETADLGITIDSPYDLTCTFAGGITHTLAHSGTTGAVASYTAVTNTLNAAQIVRVTCVADIAADLSNFAETRVNVVPVVQEL